MKRRAFLGSLLGAAAALYAPKLPAIKKPLAIPVISTGGFGLAAVKKEGASVLYDASAFKPLWPGVKAWYEKAYSEHAEAYVYHQYEVYKKVTERKE